MRLDFYESLGEPYFYRVASLHLGSMHAFVARMDAWGDRGADQRGYLMGEEPAGFFKGYMASSGTLRFVTSRGYRLQSQEKWLQPAADKGYRLVTSYLFRSV